MILKATKLIVASRDASYVPIPGETLAGCHGTCSWSSGRTSCHGFSGTLVDPGLQDVSAKVTQLEDWDYILVGGFIFYFHPYLGKISILTNVFQMG